MLSDILAEVQLKLALVAKSANGEQELAQHHAPPRYCFIPRSLTVRGPSSIGNNPRSYGDIAYAIDVHCWGKDADQANRLFLALNTALRIVCKGRNYAVKQGRFSELGDTRQGIVLTCSIELWTTLTEVRLEAGAPDNERPTVTATSVEVEAPPGVPGDGEIEPGD